VPARTLLTCFALALAQDHAPPATSPRAVVESSRSGPAPLDWRGAHRLWRITVSLRLDGPTAGRLFAILEHHDRLIATFRARRASLMREIQAAVSRQPNNATLTTLVERWVHLQEERGALAAERWRALAPYLTLQQQAQLLVLLPRLDSVP
jgi:hypothetical protein